MAHCCGWFDGGFDGRPVELLVARLRGEEEAHEARGIFCGDGGHRAVGDARSRDYPKLPLIARVYLENWSQSRVTNHGVE